MERSQSGESPALPEKGRGRSPTGRQQRVADLFAWSEELFRCSGLPSPRLDAELLLMAALGATRSELYRGFESSVGPAERARFEELVERRLRKEPVAYLIGRKEFFSLSLDVSPEVLIPRPETEHVVEAAIEFIDEWEKDSRRARRPVRVLDLGTGSGNLAVAVAVVRPRALVDAVDKRAEALEIAANNARHHGVGDRIRFWHGDLYRALGEGAGPYAVILSNPPYVSRGELEDLMDDVRLYEPLDALVDTKSQDQDGFGFYRAIAAGARRVLEPGGAVIVEVGANHAEEVRGILRASGLRVLRTIEDYGGIERVVLAQDA